MVEIKELNNVKSATVGRKVEIKITQTDTLVLVSILEPGISEQDINVLIEPKSISVEIARNEIENPVISGKLFARVQKEHCRVRIKDETVVIKLRKAQKGKWKSILEEVSTEIRKVTPETRIRPLRGGMKVDSREPIEPSTLNRPTLPTVQVPVTTNGDESTINVSGALESIKQFHMSLFGSPLVSVEN